MNQLAVLIFASIALASLALVWLLSFVPYQNWPGIARGYQYLCLSVGCFFLPLSLILSLRPGPEEKVTRVLDDRIVDLTSLHGTEALIGPAKRSWMLRLPGNESLKIREVVWEFVTPRLPAPASGLTILHFSDTHFSPVYSRLYFDLVADQIALMPPYDLALFTGDLLDHESALEWVEPVFSRLRGRLGSFAILGNHDVPHRPGRVRKALRAAGFEVIDGRWRVLTLPGDQTRIAIGGTSAPWGPRLKPELPPDTDFSIVLSHTPDQFPKKATWGVDLVLAGHNHGGQIRLPGLGAILMPSRYSRRFDRGVFMVGKTLLHVSPGIGGKHPIRYHCPPEIDLIKLTRPTV